MNEAVANATRIDAKLSRRFYFKALEFQAEMWDHHHRVERAILLSGIPIISYPTFAQTWMFWLSQIHKVAKDVQILGPVAEPDDVLTVHIFIID